MVDGGGPRPRIVGVTVDNGDIYRARAVILCAGTFLRGLLHVGEATSPGGRMGEPANAGISRALERLGLRLARFKTGTPPRLDAATIDYEETRAATRRRAARTLLLSYRPDRLPAVALLDHPHDAGVARAGAGEPAPCADVHRPDSIDRAALLPLAGNQDRPLRR